MNSTLAENRKMNETLIQTDGMLKQLEKDVNEEHEKLHDRIRELETRLASKESDQKQVKSEKCSKNYFWKKSESEKAEMIKRLETVAAKQQKMLNQSDRKIEKLESKLRKKV